MRISCQCGWIAALPLGNLPHSVGNPASELPSQGRFVQSRQSSGRLLQSEAEECSLRCWPSSESPVQPGLGPASAGPLCPWTSGTLPQTRSTAFRRSCSSGTAGASGLWFGRKSFGPACREGSSLWCRTLRDLWIFQWVQFFVQQRRSQSFLSLVNK